jgi:hypothetical protein
MSSLAGDGGRKVRLAYHLGNATASNSVTRIAHKIFYFEAMVR